MTPLVGSRRRSRLALALVALGLTMTTVVPSYAQTAPSTSGATVIWTGGPDSSGPNTYVGRIEAPRAKQNIAAGANLLVTGWAADTTASGWAGFDQMQVYNGDRTKGGSKVADGMVGLSRPDIGEILGANFAKSGFSAVVKASAIQPGAATLYVYLHTANKGWWYRTVAVTQAAPPDLPFPSDPIVVIGHPIGGEIMTNVQNQTNTQELVVSGWALDRNPQNDPNGPPKTNSPYGGAGNVGIQSVTLYVDKLPGDPGYDPNVNLLGGQSGGPASPTVLSALPSDIRTGPTAVGCQFHGSAKYCQGDYSLTKSYGPNYTFAGWVSFLNQRVLQPEAWHTIFAVARSSITGRTSTASSTFYLKGFPSTGHPACSFGSFLKHNCAVING